MQQLHQRFRTLRRSFLFWCTVDVFARTATVICAVLAIAFVVDAFYPLVWQLRALLIIGLLSYTVVEAVRLIRALLYPPQYSALARSIRTSRIDQKSNLIALGMLLEQSEKDGSADSKAMLAFDYLDKVLHDWAWHRSIDRNQPLQWCLLAFALALGLFIGMSGARFAMLQHRWWNVFESRHSSDYLLQLVKPPRHAYQSGSVEIDVKSGVDLSEDQIELFVEGDFEKLERLGGDKNSATFRITNVASPLTIHAQASPTIFSQKHFIELAASARIVEHRFLVSPPHYLNQESYESEKSEIHVTAGGQLKLKLLVSDSTHRVSLNLFKAGNVEPVSVEAEEAVDGALMFDLTNLGPNTAKGDATGASLPASYQIKCAAIDRFGMRYDLDYPLRVVMSDDIPPTFGELSFRQTSSNGTESVYLESTISDDFGVKFASVHFQGISTANSTVDPSLQLSRTIFLAKQSDVVVKSLNVNELLAMEDFAQQWPSCDAVDVFLTATDIAGQEARSIPLRLRLIDEDSDQLKLVQSASKIQEQQKKLQEDTNKFSQLPAIRQQSLEELADRQKSILEQWQQEQGGESLDSQQEKISNAVRQMMEASRQNLVNGDLVESSNIQEAILSKLNQFAQAAQASKDSNTQLQVEEATLTSLFSDWERRQNKVLESLERLEPTRIANIAEEESALQRDISKVFTQLDTESEFSWSLSQVISQLARVNAKLQREQLDSTTLVDAKLVADILQSLTKSARSFTDENDQSGNAETAESDTNQSSKSAALVELRIIREIQVSLRDRLAELANAELSQQGDASLLIEAIGEQQAMLADRTQELAKGLE